MLRSDIIAPHLPRAFRDYTIDVSPTRKRTQTHLYMHTQEMADVNTYTEGARLLLYRSVNAVAPTHLTRTTCFARRVRSRSDNVSGVFGEHRPPSPAGRLDSTRRGRGKRRRG